MINDNVELKQLICPNCHILFWISLKQDILLNESKENFYCPRGHSMSYVGKTNEQRLKEKEDLIKRLRDNWTNAEQRSGEYYREMNASKRKLKKLEKPKKDKKKARRTSKQGGKK